MMIWRLNEIRHIVHTENDMIINSILCKSRISCKVKSSRI